MAFGMPSMSMPGMPNVGLPDIPGIPGMGGDSLDIDDLMQKLAVAEKKVYGCVDSVIPKVDIVLPLLPSADAGKPMSISCSCAKEPEIEMPLLSPDAQKSVPDAREIEGGVAEGMSEKEAALKRKSEAAKAKAAKAAQEMEAKAEKMAKEAGEQLHKQFVAPAMAAATSVAIAVSLAYMTALHAVAPWLNGALGALVNSMGFAYSWQTRSGGIFDLVNGVFGGAKQKVTDMLETVDDMIMGPVQNLFGAIDSMVEEQKPVFEKAKQLEATLKVDIPDADDLKKPLDGCESKITSTIDMVKKEIPAKMDAMVQSTFAGRVATQRSTWNLHVVYMPVAIIVVFNLSIAMATVYFTLPAAAGGSEVEQPPPALRSLRGGHHHAPAKPDGLPSSRTMPGLPSSQDQIIAYLKPTLVQIVLAALQLAMALGLSQKPRVAGFVNTGIKSLAARVNDDINSMIRETADKTIGVAFKAVKDRADQFFPKIKDVMDKMKPLLQMMS
eukprot:CAMPEP_0204521588 /NCGR_PEP_ID=MMETSP0661-20131031/5861_1 /ASSEMBLY_ACC=CAM_ASM_000606 /TAXON_ID=109239 /ORGANISM="Alexandrium margalefi, Strain AMGDE01CS-322" /LENGTH=496 /DNA_ID=CAMNT_0051527195 /DNA_START=40 /DNA_END=1530 /DNA_ORIENTATION=+